MSLENAFEEAKRNYNERAAGKSVAVIEHQGYTLRYCAGARPVLLFEEPIVGNRVTAVLPATTENSYFLLRRMGYDCGEGIRAMTESLNRN